MAKEQQRKHQRDGEATKVTKTEPTPTPRRFNKGNSRTADQVVEGKERQEPSVPLGRRGNRVTRGNPKGNGQEIRQDRKPWRFTRAFNREEEKSKEELREDEERDDKSGGKEERGGTHVNRTCLMSQ